MDPYVNKVRLSLMVVGQVIGPHCLYCVLSLLRLIFKAYKDLTTFHVFLSYVPVIRVKAELAQ